MFHRTIALDDQIIPLLLQARFYGVARLGFISLDWHLITSFVERWDPRHIHFIFFKESVLSHSKTLLS